MNTKAALTLCFLPVLTLGCVSGHGGKPKKAEGGLNIRDHDVLPLLLLNYKLHTRVLCGRLLEHFAVEDLREQASTVIENAGSGMLDKNSEWLKNISIALGEPFPFSGVAVEKDQSGERAVSILWGGGLAPFYGLVVGSKRFVYTNPHTFVIQCAPGIYVWHVSPGNAVER